MIVLHLHLLELRLTLMITGIMLKVQGGLEGFMYVWPRGVGCILLEIGLLY